jgi:DNA-binding NtrC family response regulator
MMALILLAIDDAQLRRRVRRGLEEADYPVVAVADAIMLLRLLRAAHHPAIVFLDVTPSSPESMAILPLLVYERFLMPKHAYIFCTAQSSWSAMPQRTTPDGQVLTKPFTIAELLYTVAQAAAQLTLRDAVSAQ